MSRLNDVIRCRLAHVLTLWIICQEYITLCKSDDSTCDDGYGSFYDFTYCLSEMSSCSQCQPCWNDHKGYSDDNGAIQTCSDSSTCSTCEDNCKSNFASSNYDDFLNDNCAILSKFIDQIVTKTRNIDTSNANSTVLISCDNASSLLSMQWALLIDEDDEECMDNILTNVSSQCDGQSSCNYNYITDYQSSDCSSESDTVYFAIGAYCIPSGTTYISDAGESTSSGGGNALPVTLIYILVALIGLFSGIIVSVICYKTYKKLKGQQWSAHGGINDKGGSETVPSRQPSDVGLPDNGTANYIPPTEIQNGEKNGGYPGHGRNNSVQISNDKEIPYNRRGSESYPASNVLNNPGFVVGAYKAYDGSNVHANQQKYGVQYTIDVPASNQPQAFDFLVNPQLEDEYGNIPQAAIAGPGPRYSYSADQQQLGQQQPQGQGQPQQGGYGNQHQGGPIQGMQGHPDSDQYSQYQQHPQHQQMQAQVGGPHGVQQQQQMQYNQQYASVQGQQGFYPQQMQQGNQYPQYMHNPQMYNRGGPNGSFDQTTAQFLPNGNHPNHQITNFNHGQPQQQQQQQQNFGGQFYDQNGVRYTNNPNVNSGAPYGAGYNDPNGNGMMVTNGMNTNDQFNNGMDFVGNVGIVPIEYNEIAFEAEVGRGASGKVFKARWRNTEVAAKRFRKEDVNDKKAQILIDEIREKASKLESPHVLKIYGYCKNSALPFCLVTEFMDQGSVKGYVRKDRPGATRISTLERLEMALQAAKGLKVLHDNNIVHRDLAARNLLYSTDKDSPIGKRVVVADYGLSRILNEEIYSATYTNVGPLKWMAPEAISENQFSIQSDIYSFGITLWELLTGQDPYPDVDPVNTAMEVLVKERRPQLEHFNVPPPIKKLLKECWVNDASKRPSVDDVIKVLTEFIDQEKKLLENDEYFDY